MFPVETTIAKNIIGQGVAVKDSDNRLGDLKEIPNNNLTKSAFF